jgi:hypothetical protein
MKGQVLKIVFKKDLASPSQQCLFCVAMSKVRTLRRQAQSAIKKYHRTMQVKNCKVYEVGEVAFNKAGSKWDRRNVLSHAHCSLRDVAGNKFVAYLFISIRWQFVGTWQTN